MIDSLAEKYGAFFKRGQRLRVDGGEPEIAQLRPSMVPEELWPIMHYAGFWGIADDTYRIELINQAPSDIWIDFRSTVSKYENIMLDWLAGPEADATPSPEYVAFSFLLQAYYWPREQ